MGVLPLYLPPSRKWCMQMRQERWFADSLITAFALVLVGSRSLHTIFLWDWNRSFPAVTRTWGHYVLFRVDNLQLFPKKTSKLKFIKTPSKMQKNFLLCKGHSRVWLRFTFMTLVIRFLGTLHFLSGLNRFTMNMMNCRLQTY